MEIKKEEYYAIVKMENGRITEYFNSRVYLGKFVMSAYRQIKNAEDFVICKVSCKPVNK